MSSSHYAPRCQLNKNDFSCRRNSPMSLSGWRILAGRLFQSRGPAAAKLRQCAYVMRLVDGCRVDRVRVCRPGRVLRRLQVERRHREVLCRGRTSAVVVPDTRRRCQHADRAETRAAVQYWGRRTGIDVVCDRFYRAMFCIVRIYTLSQVVCPSVCLSLSSIV